MFDALKEMQFVRDCDYHAIPPLSNVWNESTIFSLVIRTPDIGDDSRCPKLVEDLVYLNANNDGSKHKQKVKEQRPVQPMKKLGHLSYCIDYLATTFLKDDFRSFLKAEVCRMHVGDPYISPNLYYTVSE